MEHSLTRSRSSDLLARLLRIRRIVEKHCQLDAAVAELGKVVFRRIAGVEVRRGIIRRKQHQRIQEGLERDLSTASQRRILVA